MPDSKLSCINYPSWAKREHKEGIKLITNIVNQYDDFFQIELKQSSNENSFYVCLTWDNDKYVHFFQLIEKNSDWFFMVDKNLLTINIENFLKELFFSTYKK